MLEKVIHKYGLQFQDFDIQNFGSGLINKTWKLNAVIGEKSYVLQQINKSVFKSPVQISENLNKIGNYLAKNHPNYLFVSSLPSKDNDFVIKDDEEEYYKLSNYINGSIAVNTVMDKKAAYEAARKFAEFTKLLVNFDISKLNYPLPNFHNLTLRFIELENQLQVADKDRLEKALTVIHLVYKNKDIVDTYDQIVTKKMIPLRVIHHDTKINNVLFDDQYNGICVIDLDTVMPGYFISDVGDMMRTYLSPVDEEEQDLSKIEIREGVFKAIVEGYFKEMGNVLSSTEKQLFVYAGKFLIYMQAVRFLTDYLNNDRYYGAKYEEHNLTRAKNQITLLEKYNDLEHKFQSIVADYSK
ncbi:phosphotransferase enzyme family protein [Pedobacter insulae]|uniref:Phosphotransferase enzyme family protein n=1 Tax=Pedobacter insulae TaxID=414048 RepID=A0A1I2UHU0_9SPHI|nr:phosphotransferase [Pedobacter insulae]SFG75919.1 Phosphotransferase enzyme family protein [Pedobacter insulae]